MLWIIPRIYHLHNLVQLTSFLSLNFDISFLYFSALCLYSLSIISWIQEKIWYQVISTVLMLWWKKKYNKINSSIKFYILKIFYDYIIFSKAASEASKIYFLKIPENCITYYLLPLLSLKFFTFYAVRSAVNFSFTPTIIVYCNLSISWQNVHGTNNMPHYDVEK